MSTKFGDFFNLFKEIDLSQIQAEAKEPFSLLIAGELTLASALANNFSKSEGKIGIHPWVVVEGLPLRRDAGDLSGYDIALLVSKEIELGQALGHLLSQLNRMNVPTIVVIVNEVGDSWIGANLVRRYETGRLVLPSVEPDIIQEELVELIVKAIPNRQLTLARQLPLLRPIIIRNLIEDTSRANAVYAASTGLAEIIPVLDIPLNVADIVILTKNQLVMAYKIALGNGKEGAPYKLLGEIVSVIGGGFLLREIARKLVGLIPVIGIVPKVAVSYAGTRAIGEIVYLWASGGQQLEEWEVDSIYDEAMERGRGLAESIIQMIGFGKDPTTTLPPPDKRWWWQRGKEEVETVKPLPSLPMPNEEENEEQTKWWWQRGKEEVETVKQLPSLPIPSEEKENQEKENQEKENQEHTRWWHRFRRETTSDSSAQ